VARAGELGLPVSRPWGDSKSYDRVVGTPGKFVAVQVKCTVAGLRNGKGYTCTVCSSHKAYEAGAFCGGLRGVRRVHHSQGSPGTLGPRLLDISSSAHPGKNAIEISGGSGTASAQTVIDYYVPWNSELTIPKPGPLKLNVTYDRTRLEMGARATCRVTGNGLLLPAME
jgi:hypothetical protein